MSFEKFNFNININKALVNSHYLQPTPIQDSVIPLIKQDADIMAKAQTGSGKTASFVLPILDNLVDLDYGKKEKIKVLVLTPTRELTVQVTKSFEQFSKYLEDKPKIVSVIGGESIGDQLLQIQKGCSVVVASLGRLLDIINKKQIDLSTLNYLVLDEADKMLDLGFLEQLDTLLEQLPKHRQNLLFSATYPQKMIEIASKVTNSAKEISIKENNIVDTITQRAILVNKEKKNPLLQYLIRKEKLKKVIVFMANKRSTDNIANKFRRYGFAADSFHGDLTQDERNYTLDEFKEGKINILFSTDIASRGLHIDDIQCVINYDLPRGVDDYIHRIGRTARAGKSGSSITFVDQNSFEHWKLIEKKVNISLELEQIDGFEFDGVIEKKQKGQSPIKGKRKSKKDKLRELKNKEKE